MRISLICGRLSLLVVPVAALFALGLAGAATPSPEGVHTHTYLGWPDAVTLEAPAAEVKATVLPSLGGRIVRFDLYGENMLLDRPEVGRGTAKTIPDPAGYQLSAGSISSNGEASAITSTGKWKIESMRDHQLSMSSESGAGGGAQLLNELVLDPESGDLGLMQKLRNSSDHEVRQFLRDRTQCRSGGFVIVPLSKSSRFPARWVMRHVVDGKDIFEGVPSENSNIKVLGDCLVIEARGVAGKIATDTDAGWVAYTIGRKLLVKYFPHDWSANYPEGGHTVEITWDDSMAELSVLGPESKIKAGGSCELPEKWMLSQVKEPAANFKQARALTTKIPPSPFK